MNKNNLSYKNVYLPLNKSLYGGNRTQKQKRNNFLFTIITVVLNDKDNIEETIKSVINQKKNLEYIIIDGGSKDGTIDVIKKYEKHVDLWISENDEGIFDAMNKGLIYASGKYLGIINSGDLYNENALNIIEKYFAKKDNIDFIFGTVKKKKVKHGFSPRKILWSFDFYPSHSSGFFIKNEVQKKLGLYDISFKLSADHDLFYRMLKEKFKGLSTKKKELIGTFRKVNVSYSSTFSAEDHLNEEINIRLNHFQNKLLIILILINNYLQKIFKKKKYRISTQFLINKIFYIFK